MISKLIEINMDLKRRVIYLQDAHVIKYCIIMYVKKHFEEKDQSGAV